MTEPLLHSDRRNVNYALLTLCDKPSSF